MEAALVTVEVHLANGLPNFTIVGLPETEVKESKDRVRAALQNCRFDFPARRITVNLAPADLPKESGRFNLPIALGILAATGQIPSDKLAEYEYAGELALTGELRPIRGALAMTYRAVSSGRAFILLQANAAEAALVEDAVVYPAQTLLQVAAHLAGRSNIAPYISQPQTIQPHYPDMREVKGQTQAKRALEIVAAGRAQRADDGAARHRQIHAGSALSRHPAANVGSRSVAKRGATVVGWLLRCGEMEDAAVSRATPYRFRRGTGRRRQQSAPR
jgi:magnesium chelatase family protein